MYAAWVCNRQEETPAREQTGTAKAAFGGTGETAGIGAGDAVATDLTIQPKTR